MKAQVKVKAGLVLEVESAKQKDLFKAIASAHEVFGEAKCGLCGSDDIVPRWRVVTVVKGKKTETFEFPEVSCQGLVEGKGDDGKPRRMRCGARLAMGTINDDTGTLYPQRKLVFRPEDKAGEFGRPPSKEERENGVTGEYRRCNGWSRFKGEKEEG